MRNNSVVMGLIACYNVYVTSCTENGISWYQQLFSRFARKTHKDVYKFDFNYEAKFENNINLCRLYKLGDSWFYDGTQIYFTREDLINSL